LKYKRTKEIEARSLGGASNIKLNQLDKEKISQLVDKKACIGLKGIQSSLLENNTNASKSSICRVL